MKKVLLAIFVGLVVAGFICGKNADATCAKVSMETSQSLTLERVAFDAKLGITNSIPDQAINDIRVDVTITDMSGTQKNDLFFVRAPVLTGISGALDGTGSVAAGSSCDAHWLIVPSAGAGGQSPAGVDYQIGATLSYTIGTKQETVIISPAKITVAPEPQLVLDYFMPYAVLGDYPYTPQVEPSVPYALGLRIVNEGYGKATNLRIDSAQPKIVANDEGLLVEFKLLGATVNDAPFLPPSLTVAFGDLGTNSIATAQWQMISTMSGNFKDFSTTFTHSSQLGGDLTSLLKSPALHYLTHMVRVNLPGRDGLLDFLGYDTDLSNNADRNPQYIWESEIPTGSTGTAAAKSAVMAVPITDPLNLPAHPTPDLPAVTLKRPTDKIGWVYTKIDDPSQGLLKLLDVVRDDGVHLDAHNFWVEQGFDPEFQKITWSLHFLDHRDTADTSNGYTLKFDTPKLDTTPPVSSLIFDGRSTGSDPVYITPATRIIVTATDNDGGSGVAGMYRKIVGMGTDTGFEGAYPFKLSTPGNYTVQYYSVDLAPNPADPANPGNKEAVKSANIVVVDKAPTISSFTATPASFSPQAPRGIKAARSADFRLTAASGMAALPVEIAISSGATFQANQVVRTLKGTATSGTPFDLIWDGKDSNGKLLPVGSYTAQLKIADGLDNPADSNAPVHTATATTSVKIDAWFVARPVDPNPAADQLHPKISGTKVVWQDKRSGHWDIYLKDLTGVASASVPGTSPDREHPAIDGDLVVWQDYRNGNWDIYAYDFSTGEELPISVGAGDQILPAVSGKWVVWQDNRSGNWDIWAYNVATREDPIQITSHERDQIHPSISGTTVSWEDYRHGLGEIYQFDLVNKTETQASYGPTDEVYPALSASSLVWSDRRNGQSDIFQYDAKRGPLRVTYGLGDHGQPALLGDLMIYTDYESGSDDPNLSFRILSNGVGDRLESNPARQEEPALGSDWAVWQDTRKADSQGGNSEVRYQIYAAPLTTEPFAIEAQIKPGFNLVAVGNALAARYPSASALLGAADINFGIDRLLLYDPVKNTFSDTSIAGVDFSITKGAALVIYAKTPGTLKLAESGESTSYTLLSATNQNGSVTVPSGYSGTNQIGILTVPSGYSAYDMMTSIGLGNIQSMRRFDGTTGSWQTVTVRTVGGVNSLVGANFAIQPGDGLVLTMKNKVESWQP